jgi:hypothetical protein
MAEAKAGHRGHGEDSIYFDATKIRYVGAISLGFDGTGAPTLGAVSPTAAQFLAVGQAMICRVASPGTIVTRSADGAAPAEADAAFLSGVELRHEGAGRRGPDQRRAGGLAIESRLDRLARPARPIC